MTNQAGIQFRQGDVLIVLNPEADPEVAPRGATEVQMDSNRNAIILAYGEVTGHAHAIEVPTMDGEKPAVRYWDRGAERFIQALVDVTLRHEEHGAIVLKKGFYRQAFQTEDFGTERRAVAD